MAFTDRYGLPLTTTSAEAAERYAAFLDRSLAAAGGADDALQRALAADPGFALAHAAQAFLHAGNGNLTAARESATRATAVAASATSREQSAVATVAALVAGEGPRGVALLRQHLEQYPRDIAAVRQATLLVGSGAAGDADPRRARLDLLERLAAAYGDDWAFLTMYGFALNEVGRHDQARTLVERALAGNPRSGTAAHAFAHVFYETGDPTAGAAFLDGWLPGYPPDAGFFVHNHWHLAVFELQQGHLERAMEVYRTGVSPDTERSGPAVLIGGGATALLWRAVLAGYPTDALPWGPVRDYFDRVGPRLGDAFRALWDGYAAVTYAAAGDEAGYRGLEERLAGADPARYPQAAPVILPLARAVWAFARGDFDAAATALEALAPDLVRIGGSNEQRDTFDDTVVAALVRAGRYESAERLLRARLGRRPSAQDSLWLAEALAATGRRADAAEHLRRAPEGWATADPEGPERSALHRVQAAAAAEGEIPSAGEVTAKSG